MHDYAKQDVAGIAILPIAFWREFQLQARCERDEFLLAVVLTRVEFLLGVVFRDARRVVQ